MTNTPTYRALLWLPNTVTITRLLAGLLLFAFISYDGQINGWRLACFVAIALTDWVDGWLARKINAHTGWGQLLDPIADKVVLLFAFGYFYFTGDITVWFTLLYFIRELLQTAIRIVFFSRNKSDQTPTLFISKLKTALSYLYVILLFAEQVPGYWPGIVRPAFVHFLFEVIIIVLSYAGFIKPFLKK